VLLITSGTVRHEVEPIGTVSLPSVWDCSDEGSGNLFSSWLFMEPYRPRRVPELALIISRLADRTGWSNRRIAEVVGTTHPTIQAMKSGRTPERRPELADALFKTAEVVEKISRLAEHDQMTLKAILGSRGSDGRTPLQLLAAGEYAKAYLRSLDVLNGPRETPGLLNVVQVRQPGQDIGLIFDDNASE